MDGTRGRRSSRADDGFLAHRSLIVVACGTAMIEAALLVAFAPAARALAPQVTALAPLGYFHDLRWLFSSQRSWPGFVLLLAALLLSRSALNTALIRLSWPRGARIPAPLATFRAALPVTAFGFLLMSPIVSLSFGLAILPFSWPYLAMVPAMLLLAVPLSHAGVLPAWWRTLPPAVAVGWLLAEFAVLSAVAALADAVPLTVAVPAAGVAGLVNARGWYGVTTAFAFPRVHATLHERMTPLAWWWGPGLLRVPAPGLADRISPGSATPASPAAGPAGGPPPGPGLPGPAVPPPGAKPPPAGQDWTGVKRRVPAAPLALAVVIALVIVVTRLVFVVGSYSPLPAGLPGAAPPAVSGLARPPTFTRPGHGHHHAVLEVAGFGSWCCAHDRSLARAIPDALVEQFSYRGMSRSGQPLPYGRAASDVALPTLGDRMAAQVLRLYRETGAPVDVVAESEGTLGVYALLAQHPHVPVGSVVLLSPIVAPGQDRYTESAGSAAVAGRELHAVIWFIGGLSPFGTSGAQRLIDSVNSVGARFADTAQGSGVRLLQIIPLADAVTLPACRLHSDVLVVPAMHGSLLGNPAALRMVRAFLSNQPVRDAATLRSTAWLVASAATAWRMPAGTSPTPPCQP